MMRRSRSRDGVALPPSTNSEDSAAAAATAAASGNVNGNAAEGGKILSLRLGDLVCVTQETKGEREKRARMRQAAAAAEFDNGV